MAAQEQKEYDYDLVTIGAGSGGVRASRLAAGNYGAKVRRARAMPPPSCHCAHIEQGRCAWHGVRHATSALPCPAEEHLPVLLLCTCCLHLGGGAIQ